MFDATKKYINSENDIQILINLHDEKENEELYFKAMIIFLATNLEVFAEEIIEEYIYTLQTISPLPNEIDDCLIFESLKNIVNDKLVSQINNRKESAIRNLKQVAELLNDNTTINEFNIKAKFNYGKHGENEFKKLFKIIDIDVFAECEVYKEVETMLSDDNDQIKIQISDIIGSLTRVRNTLLHENKISTEIDLVKFKEILKDLHEFSILIDKKLESKIDKVKELILQRC